MRAFQSIYHRLTLLSITIFIRICIWSVNVSVWRSAHSKVLKALPYKCRVKCSFYFPYKILWSHELWMNILCKIRMFDAFRSRNENYWIIVIFVDFFNLIFDSTGSTPLNAYSHVSAFLWSGQLQIRYFSSLRFSDGSKKKPLRCIINH